MSEDLTCLVCGTELTYKGTGRKPKYCSQQCRDVSRNAGDSSARNVARNDKREAIKRLRGQEGDDLIRDTMRDEVRKSLSQHVKDKVLGAGETLVGMLPLAMIALSEDLQSDDWAVRSRAYSLALKYGMPLMDAEANKDVSPTIVIHHGVPLPETDFGRAAADVIDGKIVDEIEAGGLVDPDKPYDPVTNPEKFERNWPLCKCDEPRRHPPDNMYDEKWCKPCRAQEDIKARMQRTESDFGPTD